MAKTHAKCAAATKATPPKPLPVPRRRLKRPLDAHGDGDGGGDALVEPVARSIIVGFARVPREALNHLTHSLSSRSGDRTRTHRATASSSPTHCRCRDRLCTLLLVSLLFDVVVPIITARLEPTAAAAWRASMHVLINSGACFAARLFLRGGRQVPRRPQKIGPYKITL